MIYVHVIVERMAEVELSSFCICLDNLISMYRHLLITKEKEVAWQFMRCFLSFGSFVLLAIVLLVVLGIAHIESM